MSEPKYPLKIAVSLDANDPIAGLEARLAVRHALSSEQLAVVDEAAFRAARRVGKSALMASWQREIETVVNAARSYELAAAARVMDETKSVGTGITVATMAAELSDACPNLLTEEKREKPMTIEWVRRSDYEAVRAERDKYEAMWKQVASIGPAMEPPKPVKLNVYLGDDPIATGISKLAAERVSKLEKLDATNTKLLVELAITRKERDDAHFDREAHAASAEHLLAENRALRSQLALAEERKRPARHRPGAVVNVGWDPEGD